MKKKCYERIEREFKEKPKSIYLVDENKKVIELFSFEYQPVRIEYDNEGIEHLYPEGDICHKIRFTLKSKGKYILQITFESGESKNEEFVAEENIDEGYIEVSKKDRRYFSYSSGKDFYPIGVNLAFPRACGVSNGKEFGLSGKFRYMGLRQYERWFKKCAENGVNLVRIWVGHP